MLAHLKISSRILIVFIGLLAIYVSSGLIFLHSNAYFEPNAFEYDNVLLYEWSERKFYFDEIKDIQITRGFWNVVVIPSDSNFIKIKGGMNILNYHLIADQTDTDVIFSLSDSIKDDFLYKFDAEVYTKSLESINLESFANVRIDSTKYDSLNVTLKNGAMLQLKDCIINELNFTSYDVSTLETESCFIGNVSSSMYDSSYAIIHSAENTAYNIPRENSVLMTYDADNNFNCLVSDSLLQRLSAYPELAKNIKWGSLIQVALEFEENELDELDSNSYYNSDWKEPRLSYRRSRAWNTYKFHRQYLQFENELFIEGVKNQITFNYSRGLLYSIDISFRHIASIDSLKTLMLKRINEIFDIPVELFSEKSFFKTRNMKLQSFSYGPDPVTESLYHISFYKWGSMYTDVDFTVSHSISEIDQYRNDKYNYNRLPFMSYRDFW